MKNWMRMINSAQREIVLEAPKTLQTPGLEQLRFNIQGMEMTIGGRGEFEAYQEMAERGIRKGWAEPLGIMQRLRREQAPLGWLRYLSETNIEVHFWSASPLALSFNLETEQDGIHWRECEIMVMSAGFHFSKHPQS